ncbi:UNVERIFIED_ORG: hypothetical protein ABIB52_004652 [Arthrobacter sp. UYCu721]
MSSIVDCGITGLRPRPLRTFPSFARPSLVNRARQARTVPGATPATRAIHSLASPLAAIRSTCARWTSQWEAVCDFDNTSNTAHCSSDITKAGAGFDMPAARTLKSQPLRQRHAFGLTAWISQDL